MFKRKKGKWYLEHDDKFENAIFPIPGEYDTEEAARQAASDLILAEQSMATGELDPRHFAYLGDKVVPEYDKDRLIIVGPNNTRMRVTPAHEGSN